MNAVCVKDIMIPLEAYAVVSQNATIEEAIRTLVGAEAKLPPDRQPPRAVLVIDKNKIVVGQVGYHDFLGVLEPKYNLLGDLDSLSRAGVHRELLDSIIEHQRFWQGDLPDVCERVRGMKVTEIMHPVTESIDEMAPISEAIHKIVMLRAMRMLVLSGGDVIGVVRLADLFAEMAKHFCAGDD